ncbi:MAG: hypothetical protein AAB543_06245 [Pseudomonadota bacterium]
MSGAVQMRLFAGLVAALSAAALVYVFAFPPPSMRASRDGVPHFTPPTVHPETGQPLAVGDLARHFKGVKP